MLSYNQGKHEVAQTSVIALGHILRFDHAHFKSVCEHKETGVAFVINCLDSTFTPVGTFLAWKVHCHHLVKSTGTERDGFILLAH